MIPRHVQKGARPIEGYRWLTTRSTALVAWLLGAMLFLAASDKLFHLEGFYNAVASYALVPTFLESALPLPIIVAEVLLGLGLFTSRWRRTAAWAVAGLFGLFSIALASNLLIAPGSVCGCWFTLGANTPSGLHIAQNVTLLMLSVTIALEKTPMPSRGAGGQLLSTRPKSLDT